jgi:multidrug efflux pump subunit AcrA (membrane-fusion protein)
MRVTALVNLGDIKETTVIPAAALLFDNNDPYTFVVEDSIVRRQPLELGTRDKHIYQVLSGVEVGDVVVTTGKQRVTDGSKITTQSE